MGVAALAVIAACCLGAMPAGGAAGPPILAFTASGSPLVLTGDGCTAAEPEFAGGGGGTASITLTWHWEGDQEVGPSQPLANDSFQADLSGNWTYEVPARPLAVVPSWATTEVIEAKVRCSQGIADFDYAPIDDRRAVDHPATTTTPAGGSDATATPATPVASDPAFTG